MRSPLKKFHDFLTLSGIYFITSDSFGYSHIDLAKIVLDAGIRIIQFRDKKMCTADLILICKEIKELCETYNAILIVNDRVDIALACDADGVHLGKKDMPPNIARSIFDGIIGYSAKTLDDLNIFGDFVDYFGVGPVFPTSTKRDAGKVLGVEGLKRFKKATSKPIVAIGGINKNNIVDVLKTGVDGIAVISAIANSKDPKSSAKELLEIYRKFRNSKS